MSDSKHNSDTNPQGHEFLQNILSTKGKKKTVDSNSKNNPLNTSDNSAKVDSVDTKNDSTKNIDTEDSLDNSTSLSGDVGNENSANNESSASNENTVSVENTENIAETEETNRGEVIHRKAASAPKFEKVGAIKKTKDSPEDTEFEKVKPHTERMTDGTKIIDKNTRRKKIVQVTLSILAIFSIVFLSGIVYNVLQQSKKPDTPILSQIEEDNIEISKTPQKSIMHQIAEQKNPDFDTLISKEFKQVHAEEGLFFNNEGSASFGVDGYNLNNTNFCDMNKNTDFCYVAELIKDGSESSAGNVSSTGNVYAFKNIFQNQFFNDFENPVEEEVDGFDYAATADVKVAGNDAYVILLGQESGLGYGIVTYDVIERDTILSAIYVHNTSGVNENSENND